MADNSFGVSQKSTSVSDRGCWSTHQHQTLSGNDLQSLPIYGVSKGEDIQHVIICKHPFSEPTDTPAPLVLKETTRSPIKVVSSGKNDTEETNPSKKNNMEKVEIKETET